MPKKGSKRGGGARPKPQQSSNKDAIERKRDERAQRNKLKKERRLKEFHGDYTDDDFVNFRRQLEYQGFKLREIQGDGNCLFRALADQLNGDSKLHMRHRKDVVEYMRNHKEDFAPFLDETVTFEKYLQNLGSNGTYGGNDSIVAFARKHSVDVVIHQYDSPAFAISGDEGGCEVKLHLAYHTMEHYSSVRAKDDPGDGPAHLFHRSKLLQKTQTKDEKDIRKEKDKNKKKVVDESKFNGEKMKNLTIERLKNSTGFQDEEKIKEYLNENEEDFDMTLSYILQLMAISEEPLEQKDYLVCQDALQGSEIIENLNELNQLENDIQTDALGKSVPIEETGETEPDVEIVNSEVFSKDDDEVGNETPIDIPEVIDTASNACLNEKDALESALCEKDILKLDTSENYSLKPAPVEKDSSKSGPSEKDTIKPESIKTEFSEKDTVGPGANEKDTVKPGLNVEPGLTEKDTVKDGPKEKDAVKPGNFEKIDKCKCEENNKCECQGVDNNKNPRHAAKNKPTPRGGKVQNQRKQHLSNRQRKELAKQERKKRREENKRGESSGTRNSHENNDEIPTTPADIHVISI